MRRTQTVPHLQCIVPISTGRRPDARLILHDEPDGVPNSQSESEVVRGGVVVIGKEDIGSKECRCLVFDLVRFCVATMPKGLIVVSPGIVMMKGVYQWAEDGPSSIASASYNAALHLGIQRRQVRC